MKNFALKNNKEVRKEKMFKAKGVEIMSKTVLKEFI